MRDQPFCFTKTKGLRKQQIHIIQGAISIPQDLSVAEAHLFTNQLFNLKRNPVLGHGVQSIPVFAMRSHFSVERPPKNVTTTQRTFFDQEDRIFNTDDGDHEVAPLHDKPLIYTRYPYFDFCLVSDEESSARHDCRTEPVIDRIGHVPDDCSTVRAHRIDWNEHQASGMPNAMNSTFIVISISSRHGLGEPHGSGTRLMAFGAASRHACTRNCPPLHALLNEPDAETALQSQGPITRTNKAADLSAHTKDIHSRGHLGAAELGQTRTTLGNISSNRKPVAKAIQGATIHAK
ncbi:hypothetical protein PG995_007419 [Apiospora arundinis]